MGIEGSWSVGIVEECVSSAEEKDESVEDESPVKCEKEYI